MSKRLGVILSLAVLVAAAPAARSADIVGRGSIGASAGGMLFLSGAQFGDGNSGRPIGHITFKYNFTGRLAAVLETGYGWNAYKGTTDQDTLATVIPTTLGLEIRTRYGGTQLWPHLGFGAGMYALGVKDSYRTWARANDGRERLTWSSPGVYGRLGGEYLFSNGASIGLDVLYHQIFSKDTERFPDKWGNQNTSFGEVRLGVNYYFTLKESGPAPPGNE